MQHFNEKQTTVSIDGTEVDANTFQFGKAQKKSLTDFIQINQPFAVDTLEGTMTAQPGDYLMRGVNGELYPCAKDVFEKVYEPVQIGANNDECLWQRTTNKNR